MSDEYVMNNDGKYGYLFCQDLSGLPPTHSNPEAVARYEKFGKRQLWLDGKMIPGAFQMNTCLWMKSNYEQIMKNPNSQVGKPHSHPYPEILGFVGTNPADPSDLGGEVELWVNGEKHRITKSTMVFLPPDLPHCPLATVSVTDPDRPILHFSVVMNETYGWERKEEGLKVDCAKTDK